MQAEGVDPAVLDMDPEKPYGTPMSQTSTTQAAPEPAKPLAKPAAAKPALPTPPVVASKAKGGGGGAMPPKPTAGRANLLADIAKRRIE